MSLIRRVIVNQPGESHISWWDVRMRVSVGGGSHLITVPVRVAEDELDASRKASRQAALRWPSSTSSVVRVTKRWARS